MNDYIDRRVVKCLDIVESPVTASRFPARVAGECFHDPSLVYDVTARLSEPRTCSAVEALMGSPPGFVSPRGETLAQFIERRGRGVIVFDDLQAFDASAIATLAEIADQGILLKQATQERISASRFVILAYGRLAVPSIRELMKRAGVPSSWPCEARPPREFRELLVKIAADRFPEHFDGRVTGRFGGLDAGCAWERYCALVSRGDLDSALFTAPADLPTAPAYEHRPEVRKSVDDIAAITERQAEPGKFDVFISYSHARTADDATWLSGELRERGYGVCFDREAFSFEGLPDESNMRTMIEEMTTAVKSSRAWIVFAAAFEPFVRPDGMNDDEAIRRGLAMRTPRGALVKWSWQTLELRNIVGRYMVVAKTRTYVVDPATSTESEPIPYQGREQLLARALEYLAEEVSPRVAQPS